MQLAATLALILASSIIGASQGRRVNAPVAARRRQLEGVTTFENADFLVQITGNSNVPKYTFSSKTGPDKNTYKVMFQKLFESTGGKKIGNSNIALPSLTWVMKDVSPGPNNETVFWINGTDLKGSAFKTLAFRNVLLGQTVKFDVIIEGYKYTSAQADALNLSWKLSNSTGSDGRALQVEDAPSVVNNTAICYYGASGTNSSEVCFAIVDTATATDAEGAKKDVAVKVLVDSEEGGGVTIQYARFEGDLMHDPQFGFGLRGVDKARKGGFLASIKDRFSTFLKRFFPSQ